MPVLGLQVPTSWHWSEAVQTTGLEPVHIPLWQVSVCVQALPSLHAEPSAFGGVEQGPGVGLQVPAVWHSAEAVQTTGLAPVHVPLWPVSVCVQALPSSHAEPSAFGGLEDALAIWLQVPTSWHWSEAVQTTGLEPVHIPLWQVSVCVQALPSLHAVPFVFGGLEQVPVEGLQVPAV